MSSILSLEKFEFIAEIIPNVFDQEFQRLPVTNKSTVYNFVLSFYYDKHLFRLLHNRNLTDLTDNFNANSTIREFLLNFSDRCEIYFSVSDISFEETVNTLVKGLSAGHPPQINADLYLVETNAATSLYVSEQDAKDILVNNHWLVYFYYLNFFFLKTKVGQEAVNELLITEAKKQ